MDNLIAELERATEGSRELDAAVAMIIHPRLATYRNDPARGIGHWISDKDGLVYALDYTTSLDAALTLVPGGCGWYADDAGETAIFEKEKHDNNMGALVIGACHEAPTAALALCIAAIKARQAMKDAG